MWKSEYLPGGHFISTLLWASLAGLIIFRVLKKWIICKRMPPGPKGLPFIGTMLHLMKHDPITEFQKYRKQYGNIFSFSAGNFYVIVVNDCKMIQELAKREECCGRPDFEVWKLRNYNVKNRGIAMCDSGPAWQEQRKFALNTLRKFGRGTQSMDKLINLELQDLIVRLGNKIDAPINLSGEFNASVLNSLWTVLAGKRYELDNPIFQEALNIIIQNIQVSNLIVAGFFWPFLAKWGLAARGRWAIATKVREKMRAIIGSHVDDHLSTYKEEVTRDFMDAYIHEIKHSSIGSSFYDTEGLFNLKVVLWDLFVAGAETTSTTLLWCILFLAKYPTVQETVRAEIEEVVGSKAVTRDDKPRLKYFEAFLNEVHRKASLGPMSFYHKMLKDMVYEGYLFPKDSVILFNLHQVHHDPSLWSDPDAFRPERFLDTSVTKLDRIENLMPFGTGKRQCLGEQLARDTLFIMLTGLLQTFNFKIDPSSQNVSERGTSTFVSYPQPFEVVITKRG